MLDECRLTELSKLDLGLLDLIPVNIFWKNKESQYLGYNAAVVNAFALASREDMIKRSVDHILGKKYAAPLLQNDDYVMENDQAVIFEEILLDPQGRPAVHLCKKAPLHNEQKQVIGLIGVAINLSNTILPESTTKNFTDTVPQKDAIIKKVFKQLEVGRYYLPTSFKDVYLTQRQLDCVTALLEGKSAKEIGRSLNLSHRTIEFYISKIKIKFSCHTTTELISKIALMSTEISS